MTWRIGGLIALAWIATVSAASSMIWWVISAAGTHVGTMPQVRLPAVSTTAHPPGDATTTGVWSGSGGRVAARCVDGAVSLRSAVPNDGFSVEIADRGPDELRVEFDPVDGGEDQRVRVTCGPDGRPVFRVG